MIAHFFKTSYYRKICRININFFTKRKEDGWYIFCHTANTGLESRQNQQNCIQKKVTCREKIVQGELTNLELFLKKF